MGDHCRHGSTQPAYSQALRTGGRQLTTRDTARFTSVNRPSTLLPRRLCDHRRGPGPRLTTAQDVIGVIRTTFHIQNILEVLTTLSPRNQDWF